MPELISYSVPWKLIFGLTPHIMHGTQESVDAFSAGIVARMQPPPQVEGREHLPADPRFLLVANHYQRKGLWILHSASVLTQAIRVHYGPGDPPVRWLVTANWPPVRIGNWRLASPGDWLLPRVAHALACYPVSFARSNPTFTAASLKRVLRDARTATRPIGLFPEGAAAVAGCLQPPLPGIDRLILHLAKAGLPCVPAGISETGRFVIRFGAVISAEEILASADAAAVVMQHIAALVQSDPRGTES